MSHADVMPASARPASGPSAADGNAALSAGLGGQRAVLDAALALREAGLRFALALVVAAEGSTYRKPGALALIAADGRRIGVVSGGCLEPALDMLAAEALDMDQPRTAVFDTQSDDDLLFGSGSGCRGRMQVLALPLRPGRACPTFDAILDAHARQRPLTLALAQVAPELFATGSVRLRPAPHVLLLGAGPEAPALLQFARTLGWRISIADHRVALLGPERLPAPDRLLASRPSAAIAAIGGEPLDAALIATHVASADFEALQALTGTDVGYIGLLGPPARRDELLAQLSAAERARLLPRLFAPVGLRLGGEGPEAIALAIVAELQRHFHSQAEHDRVP